MKHDHLRRLFIGLTPPLNVETLPRRMVPITPSHYVSSFTERFPQVIDLIRRMGIHPEAPAVPFLDPFSETTVTENFANIGNHSFAVAFVASAITSRLVAKGVLSAAEADVILIRALLHDIVKPYCALTARALRNGHIDQAVYFGTDRHERIVAALRDRGFTAREARNMVFDYGAETDPHRFLPQLLTLRGDSLALKHGLLAGKIVFLADGMTCSPTPAPGTVDHRVDQAQIGTLWERLTLSGSQQKYPKGWTGGLGITARGNFRHLDDISAGSTRSVCPLASYHHLMIWSAREICVELCRLMGLNTTAASAEKTVVALVAAVANAQSRSQRRALPA